MTLKSCLQHPLITYISLPSPNVEIYHALLDLDLIRQHSSQGYRQHLKTVVLMPVMVPHCTDIYSNVRASSKKYQIKVERQIFCVKLN